MMSAWLSFLSLFERKRVIEHAGTAYVDERGGGGEDACFVSSFRFCIETTFVFVSHHTYSKYPGSFGALSSHGNQIMWRVWQQPLLLHSTSWHPAESSSRLPASLLLTLFFCFSCWAHQRHCTIESGCFFYPLITNFIRASSYTVIILFSCWLIPWRMPNAIIL